MNRRQNPDNRGSLTLEAALTMPVFILVFISILSLIRMVYTQQVIQCAITQTSKAVARVCYLGSEAGLSEVVADAEAGIRTKLSDVTEYLEQIDLFPEMTGVTDMIGRLSDSLAGMAADKVDKAEKAVFRFAADYFLRYYLGDLNAPLLGIKGGIDGINLDGSTFMEKENERSVCIVARYELNLPLMAHIQGSSVIVQRAAAEPWFGSDGVPDTGKEGVCADIWSLGNLERGSKIREIFGANLPFGYPVISDYRDGTAKMIKSMDVTAPYYSETDNIRDKIEGYIGELASFNGTAYPWGSGKVMITAGEIKERILLLVIPGNACSSETEHVLEACRLSAASLGVVLETEKYGLKKTAGKEPFKE